ncbi:MAG: hypothetical protein ACI95X_002687, partial [Paraglaciecola sp.]
DSGCVFFDSFSGETLSIALSAQPLQKLIVEYQNLTEQDRVESRIHTLYRKNFLQPVL